MLIAFGVAAFAIGWLTWQIRGLVPRCCVGYPRRDVRRRRVHVRVHRRVNPLVRREPGFGVPRVAALGHDAHVARTRTDSSLPHRAPPGDPRRGVGPRAPCAVVPCVSRSRRTGGTRSSGTRRNTCLVRHEAEWCRQGMDRLVPTKRASVGSSSCSQSSSRARFLSFSTRHSTTRSSRPRSRSRGTVRSKLGSARRRREFLAESNNTFIGLKFVPTTVVEYLRPDALTTRSTRFRSSDIPTISSVVPGATSTYDSTSSTRRAVCQCRSHCCLSWASRD